MKITLRASHWSEMRAHVEDQAPLEACGILAGIHGTSVLVFPTRNLLQSPHRYQIHPQDQIRAFFEIERRGWEFLAVFHSHPTGPSTPSPTDVSEAAYRNIVHLIWSPTTSGWDCHAYRIIYGKIVPIEIKHST